MKNTHTDTERITRHSPTFYVTHANEVTDHMLVLVANCVEDWFPEGELPQDDFIDRLCEHYGNVEGWDIENLDTPAVRKIMRHARAVRREMA